MSTGVAGRDREHAVHGARRAGDCGSALEQLVLDARAPEAPVAVDPAERVAVEAVELHAAVAGDEPRAGQRARRALEREALGVDDRSAQPGPLAGSASGRRSTAGARGKAPCPASSARRGAARARSCRPPGGTDAQRSRSPRRAGLLGGETVPCERPKRRPWICTVTRAGSVRAGSRTRKPPLSSGRVRRLRPGARTTIRFASRALPQTATRAGCRFQSPLRKPTPGPSPDRRRVVKYSDLSSCRAARAGARRPTASPH